MVESMMLLEFNLMTFVLVSLALTPIFMMGRKILKIVNFSLQIVLLALQHIFTVLHPVHLVLKSLLVLLYSLDIVMHMSHSLREATLSTEDVLDFTL